MSEPTRADMYRARAKATSERQLQDAIAARARWAGWRVAHFRTSRTGSGGHATAVAYDGTGFPDLVLVREDRVIFAELKSERGRLTDAQKEWGKALEQLAAATRRIEYRIWRPTDWFDGTVERILS